MITLIIPTIGGTSKNVFLQALDSAVVADPNFVDEIVIMDNSVNKEFKEFLEYQKQRDQRIVLYHTSNRLSMAQNWNYALNHIKNNWHLYLHDDDLIYPEAIIKVSKILDNKFSFVTCDYDVLTRHSKKRMRRKPGISGIIDNTPKFVATVFNAEKLLSIGAWKDKAGYFLDLHVFIHLEAAFETLYTDVLLGAHRQHGENASSKKNRYQKYGDHIPYLLTEAFKVIQDHELRRRLVFHVSSFAYPHFNWSTRIISKLLQVINKKAWFETI